MPPDESNALKLAEMDNAAKEAAKSLPVAGTAREFVEWVFQWYGRAGYKRLMDVAFRAFGLR